MHDIVTLELPADTVANLNRWISCARGPICGLPTTGPLWKWIVPVNCTFDVVLGSWVPRDPADTHCYVVDVTVENNPRGPRVYASLLDQNRVVSVSDSLPMLNTEVDLFHCRLGHETTRVTCRITADPDQDDVYDVPAMAGEGNANGQD